MDRFTGGCLCGNVRIEASGRPYRVGICHCLDCRKHHGALFHASAIFPATAVRIDGETRAYAGRSFCPRCGSTVFGRSGDEVEVNLGSLDAPALMECPNCGTSKRLHRACSTCGHYRGRKMVEVKEEI